MAELARLATCPQAESLNAALSARPATGRNAPLQRTLVSHRHGRRDWFLRRLLALSDVVGVALALALAVALLERTDGHSWREQALYGLGTLPMWVVLFKMYGLYERDAKRLSHSTLDDLPALFHALLLGGLLTWCYFLVLTPMRLSAEAALVFGALALALILAGRMLGRAALLRVLSPERVLLIGSGEASGALIELMRTRARRFEPVGVVTCGGEGEATSALPLLGSLQDAADLPGLLEAHRIARVVVADVELDRRLLLRVLHECRTLALKVSLLPTTSSALGPSVEVDDLQGVTVLGVNPPVLSRSSWLVKRLLDLAGAAAIGIVALPLLVLLSVAIKLDSRGPVFFRQERIGRAGRRFHLLKLRTMVADAESQRAALISQSRDPGWLHLEHDPRITRMGRVLRLTSLDELPQLWNVLKGEMSLVGPRPLVAEEDRMVSEWARGRLDLTPGITGLWQVLGRTSIPFEEMVRLDYLYVTNWSLWGDLRLILRTLPVVLRRVGAN